MSKIANFTTPPLIKNITPMGNSKGIVIPANVLKQLGWKEGAQVELKIDGNSLMVSPVVIEETTAEQRSTVKQRIFNKHRELNQKLAKR